MFAFQYLLFLALSSSPTSLRDVSVIETLSKAPYRWYTSQSIGTINTRSEFFHLLAMESYKPSSERFKYIFTKEDYQIISHSSSPLSKREAKATKMQLRYKSPTQIVMFALFQEDERFIAYICEEKHEIFLAYRGTANLQDCRTNVCLTQQWSAEYFQKSVDDFRNVSNCFKGYKFFVTGHSLGGAVATLVMLFDARQEKSVIQHGEVWNAGSCASELNLWKLLPGVALKSLQYLTPGVRDVSGIYRTTQAIVSGAQSVSNKCNKSKDELLVDEHLIHHHIFGDVISASFQYGKRVDYSMPEVSEGGRHSLVTFQKIIKVDQESEPEERKKCPRRETKSWIQEEPKASDTAIPASNSNANIKKIVGLEYYKIPEEDRKEYLARKCAQKYLKDLTEQVVPKVKEIERERMAMENSWFFRKFRF